MRKLSFIIFILVIVPAYSFGQDTNPRIRELGLNLSGPHTFGVRYRAGNENTLIRLTLSSLAGSNQSYKTTSGSNKNGAAGIGFNMGFEKRKLVSDNLTFYIGSDLLTSYTSNTNESDNLSQKSTTWNVSAGLGLVLGFLFRINSDINISAEVLPSFGYTYGKSTTNYNGSKTVQTNTGINYGLSDTGANLTLSFGFGSKK